jgi:hypothetical protein
MINREERRARIKVQIAKAVSEIEHGDQAAALLALVDAFKIREELCEADYERGIAQQMPKPVGLGQGDHPRVSEVKEHDPYREVGMDHHFEKMKDPEPARSKGDKRR